MRNLVIILLLSSFSAFAEPVDTTEAKQIAINFFQYKNPTKSLINIQQTNVTQYKGITTRYTFIMGNNSFVVVSADNSTVPILAYSDNGVYSTDHSPTFELWMQSEYDELIVYNQSNNVNNEETIQKWNDIKNKNFNQTKSTNSVAPLIETRWGQSSTNDGQCPGFNFFVEGNTSCGCDHCTAGCVAVAMAQIMNFWRSPDNDFDWCNMPNELIQQDPSLPFPHIRPWYETERNAIAELIADCGDKAEMDYCSDGNCSSSSTIGKGKQAFQDDYNYSNDMLHRYRWLTISWKSKMRNSLDDGQPIFYGGNKPNGGAGHAFVCDGYQDDDYFHFNWGWRGANDGYFYIKDNDGSPVIDYYKWQEAVFYLHPENSSTVYCIDCSESITISNVVTANNPYNPYFSYMQWSGISPLYNYIPVFPFPSNRPYASEIITVNGETRLKYNDISAGTIQAENAIIPDKVDVHFKAYDKIVLKPGFHAKSGNHFTAEIIPCPNSSGSKSLNVLNDSENDAKHEIENIDNMFLRDFQVFPNPCTYQTNIIYNVKENEKFQILIYNMYGQEEYSLIKGVQPEGKYNLSFNTDKLKSGIYMCVFKTEDEIETVKLIKTRE